MYNDIVLQYDRGRTAADFVKYLNEKCGTHRQLGGLLSEEVRCLLSHTHFPSHTVTHTFTLVLTHPHTYHNTQIISYTRKGGGGQSTKIHMKFIHLDHVNFIYINIQFGFQYGGIYLEVHILILFLYFYLEIFHRLLSIQFESLWAAPCQKRSRFYYKLPKHEYTAAQAFV